jgi:hypothetical protein
LTPEGLPQAAQKKRPKLKTVALAIQDAFTTAQDAEDLDEDPKFGLLKYFSKGMAEDKKAYFEREIERAANTMSLDDHSQKKREIKKKQHERELAHLRQQRRRQLQKNQEIRAGVHSSRGSKQKVRSDQRSSEMSNWNK